MPFIAFEGVDGAGKSTLIRHLGSELDRRALGYIVTREPGGSELAEKIREILLTTKGEPPIPRAELLLYSAGRAQHVEKKIRPALAASQWILCDRFMSSSLAFQAGGRGIEEAQVDWLNQFAVAGCLPDLTVLIDITVEESMARKQKQKTSSGLDRLEREAIEFHQRVRDHYLKQSRENSNWLVLDGTLPSEKLLQLLLASLTHHGFFNARK